MAESTARAEVLTPQQSNASYYLWEVPQKPVTVRISLNVIDRLEKEVVESFRSLTSRGSEIGGILLGTVQPGNPLAIAVEDYETIPCDYSRGPLYRLGDSDMSRFERAIQQRESGGSTVVLGFFRSHTRKGLSLDNEDAAFLDARFKQPHQIALLVRPYAAKASAAGIFIWEQGSMRAECSYQEFAFRSSQLTASAAPAETSGPAPAPAAATAAPSPASPKPAARAQIVPIASRREINLPAAPAAAAPPAPSTPVNSAPSSGAAAAAAPAPAPVQAEVKAPAPAPAPAPEAKPAAPAAEPAPKPAAKKAVEPKVEAKAARSMRPLLIVALAAVLLIGVVLFGYPGVLRQRPSVPGQDTSPLALRIERTGTDILLTWNRDSDAIRKASHAVLSISDGDRHENYDMDLSRLRDGSIVYSPLSADVSFRMEVTGQGNAKTASESVRVLRTRPSPIPEENGQGTQQAQASKPATPTTAQQPVKPADPAADTANNNKKEDKPAEETPRSIPTKPFDATSLSSRLRPVTPSDAPVDLPDAPSISRPDIQAPSAVAGVNLNSMTAAPSAPPAPATKAAAPAQTVPSSANAPKLPSGGQIQQAQLVFRKEPEYPKLARQMGIRGAVDVVATIGVDGRVKNVQVLHGHPLLQKAATDAILQWQYRPTLLNGVPVQNETRITLNFTGVGQ
ncbi:MAG TPA: TonB family protein [Candidatus Limnocylindrales bacterium]|nr:TonB family protein [Candidatus Limnocylindrales bacterium]